VAEFSRKILPLLESRAVVPVIHTVLPLDHIRGAHQLIESNDCIGKIVLTVERHDLGPRSDL